MYGAFYYAERFNQVRENNHNNDNKLLTSIFQCFLYCLIPTVPMPSILKDLSKWDVSSVTTMYNMFHHGLNYNQPMENWDVSRVTNMGTMFYKAAINQVSQKFAIEATKAN